MKDILEKVNRNDGMTVPDGYFEDFAKRMTASLPQREWEKPQPKVLPRSVWQRVRPYLYLAAMFMGIWCMMKMFDLMRTDPYSISIENNPVITAALDNDHFINDYFISEGVSDYQLMDDLYETGFDPGDCDEALKHEAADTTGSYDSPEFPLSEI
ncbi:MAG: hypothetical protein NC212_00610 [Staphylococcus sp.]|nr:hypothetical protein [Staphylococcus sp.]